MSNVHVNQLRASWLTNGARFMAAVLLLMLPLHAACRGSSGAGSGDDDEVEEDSPDTGAVGAVSLRFKHQVAGEELDEDEVVYENAAGNEYSVRTFEYLVTDIRLISEDGEKVEVADAVQGNAITLGEIDHVFDGVPAGRYTALEFRWGMHPDRNENFALDASFDNLLWPPPLGGGYHAMRFEGDWTQTTPGDRSFALHSGYLRRCRDMAVDFDDCPAADRLESQGSFKTRLEGIEIVVGEVGSAGVEVTIDLNHWMNDPVIDLAEPWSDQSICPPGVGVCTLAGRAMMNPESQDLLRANGGDVFAVSDQWSAPTPVDLDLPRSGLAVWRPMPIPEDNPPTEEGIELGRRLFYDPILSGDNTLSCASCHRQGAAFSDGPNRLSEGTDGALGTFNANALINLGWLSDTPFAIEAGGEVFSMFWDGRAESLEDQVIEPVESPTELDQPWPELLDELAAHPDYPDRFLSAFGSREITQDRVAKAIAQFERSLRSYDSKWDRVQRGEATFTAAEQRGMDAFLTEEGDCFHCHGGNLSLFVNQGIPFANNGLDSDPDPGLMGPTGDPNFEGMFRTMSLRNIEVTGPYMHDGRFETLEEVLEFYSEGVATDSPNLDPQLRFRVLSAPISAQTQADIIAFLKTLTDETFLTEEAFSNPFE